MSLKVLLPVTIIFAIIIVGAVALPLFPTETEKPAFSIANYELKDGYFTYREFTVTKGSTVKITFICDREVTAYLFTENQYNNYRNAGSNTCIDSVMYVVQGNINQEIDMTGKYYFVITNRGDRNAEVVYCKGEIIP